MKCNFSPLANTISFWACKVYTNNLWCIINHIYMTSFVLGCNKCPCPQTNLVTGSCLINSNRWATYNQREVLINFPWKWITIVSLLLKNTIFELFILSDTPPRRQYRFPMSTFLVFRNVINCYTPPLPSAPFFCLLLYTCVCVCIYNTYTRTRKLWKCLSFWSKLFWGKMKYK